LKLTEILSTQLEEIKSQVEGYQEKIEEVEAERDMYKKEINVIKA
jgi:phage shock protein A